MPRHAPFAFFADRGVKLSRIISDGENFASKEDAVV